MTQAAFDRQRIAAFEDRATCIARGLSADLLAKELRCDVTQRYFRRNGEIAEQRRFVNGDIETGRIASVPTTDPCEKKAHAWTMSCIELVCRRCGIRPPTSWYPQLVVLLSYPQVILTTVVTAGH
jgi:hypothetical protein